MDDLVRDDHHLVVDDIYIRPFTTDDIDDLMVWATDDKVTHYLSWNTYMSKEDGLDFIKNIAIPHPYCRAICCDKRVLGSITVTPFQGDLDKCRAQLGYALGSKFWGKGIMTKAVSLVVSAAFERWPEIERVEAEVHVENVASQRVLEKAGFKREGVLRNYLILKGKCIDVVMFSFLRNDLE